MTNLNVVEIVNWHAHVYFDATSRDVARAFRETITEHLGNMVQIGRFHERLVGPHRMWSYQLSFHSEHFGDIVEWLTLNRGTLDIFLHPNTGDELRDHRDFAIWIGHSYPLDLTALGG